MAISLDRTNNEQNFVANYMAAKYVLREICRRPAPAGDQLPQVQGFPLVETASARKRRKTRGDTGALSRSVSLYFYSMSFSYWAGNYLHH